MTSTEAPPAAAKQLFGARLDRATRYADLLVTAGVERGLIGPRESERIWTRHVVNCAVVAELLPASGRVVDVGSGAGLPGIPLALAVPGLRVDLVEPLARRVQFLTEAVAELGLADQIRVFRGRAEERWIVDDVGEADWVTSRAVAPLDRLVGWCLPLLVTGGKVIAMKGSRAGAEVVEHRVELRRAGVSVTDVVQCGLGLVEPPVTVVVLERGTVARRSDARNLKGKS